MLLTTEVPPCVEQELGVQCAATGPESAHLCLASEGEHSPPSDSVLPNNPIALHTHPKSDARAENKKCFEAEIPEIEIFLDAPRPGSNCTL